jgi:hypothetical protein
VLQKHALRHGLTIALSNYGAPTGNLPSGGGSGIWSDRGEPVVQLEASGLGIAIAIETKPAGAPTA